MIIGAKILVQNTNVEICGHFVLNENKEKDLYIEHVSENKNTCVWPKYYQERWHTHSHISKGYPSLQDIESLYKHCDVKKSDIFTTWGVWSIQQYDENDQTQFNKNDINNLLTWLYENSEKGRGVPTQEIINEFCGNINKLTMPRINISFMMW